MKFTKGNTTVTLDKLWYLQRNHAAKIAQSQNPSFVEVIDRLVSTVQLAVSPQPPLDADGVRSTVASIFQSDARNYTTPEAFVERNEYFFVQPTWKVYEPSAPQLVLSTVYAAVEQLMSTEPLDWNGKTLEGKMKALVGQATTDILGKSDLKGVAAKEWNKEFYHYLRWVLFNGQQGPAMAQAMAILGRDECKSRFEKSKQVQ